MRKGCWAGDAAGGDVKAEVGGAVARARAARTKQRRSATSDALAPFSPSDSKTLAIETFSVAHKPTERNDPRRTFDATHSARARVCKEEERRKAPRSLAPRSLFWNRDRDPARRSSQAQQQEEEQSADAPTGSGDGPAGRVQVRLVKNVRAPSIAYAPALWPTSSSLTHTPHHHPPPPTQQQQQRRQQRQRRRAAAAADAAARLRRARRRHQRLCARTWQ